MRFNRVIVFFMLSTLIFSVGCKEYSYSDLAPKLELKIVDSKGVSQKDVIVNLYHTKDDFMTKSNLYSRRTSDGNGICMFQDLQETTYYFYVEKGRLSNMGEKITFSTPLYDNEVRKIECVIK